jgi:nitrous oxidase accessory protein NosD
MYGLLLFTSFCSVSGTITINGKAYSGKNIIISGNHNENVSIDGNDVLMGRDVPEINIQVDGNIDSLTVNACNSCVVNGSVGSLNSTLKPA